MNPRYYKPGECKYPFKYKKKVYNFPDCPISTDKVPIEFCATELGKQGGSKKHGVCLPDGVTPEQHNTRIDNLIEDGKKTEKRYKLVRKSKKTTASSSTGSWISKYYNDSNLKIIETRKNGDCFFDAIKLAYNRPSISVDSLRQMVSDNISEQHLDLYKTLFTNALANNDTEMIRETQFIKGVETLPDLKEYVKRSNFWADMLAINMIERLLKIKVFVFSETMFIAKDYTRIVNCGNNLQTYTLSHCEICGISSDLHSQIIQGDTKTESYDPYLIKHGVDVKPLTESEKYNAYFKLSEKDKHKFKDVSIFDAVKPEQFVLLHYEDGRHYKLISYKNRKMFTHLNQLPKELSKNISEICGNMTETAIFNRK